MASTSTSPYSTRFKVVAVIVLALAIGAFVAAYLATSDEGDDELGTSGAIGNDIVEQRIPAPNSQVPQQQTVGIDLVSGDGKVVEELRAGLNCVTAIVWPISEGRDAARQIPWCFTVV